MHFEAATGTFVDIKQDLAGALEEHGAGILGGHDLDDAARRDNHPVVIAIQNGPAVGSGLDAAEGPDLVSQARGLPAIPWIGTRQDLHRTRAFRYVPNALQPDLNFLRINEVFRADFCIVFERKDASTGKHRRGGNNS